MTRRGTVTIVFSDVVSSTQLTAAIGDDKWDELRRRHFASLRGSAARNRGEVVKSTGDGLMLAFGSTVDALDFAVDAQRDAAADGVPIRVGVSVGEAAFEDDGDWYGTPVVEARRLCDAAESGGILASAVVKVLAGSRGGHRFVDVAPLELKGFDERVAAVLVDWSLPAAEPPPLPRQLAAVRRRPLVGRDDALAALESVWRRAAEGTMHAALVSGEPGIGKTRLVAELATAVSSDGATVLAGICNEDVRAPLAPVIEAVEPLVARATTATALGRRANELARVFPEVVSLEGAGPPTSTDPDTERMLLFSAVGELLLAASAASPVLFVLDDLHWADSSTLDLLQYLVRSKLPARLLVAGTYRDTDLGRDHRLAALLADLRREHVVERIALRGIDRDAVAAIAGETLPAAVVAAIHEETDGNPFFVEEVVDHLRAAGDEGRIPEGVKEVVGRRLSRLPSAANDVLAVAAVAGREFDSSIVREVADLSFDELVDVVEAATAAGVVDEISGRAGSYAFRHALIRQVLYDELSTLRRTRTHWAIGEVLAKRGADPASVALHLSEGALAGDPRRAAQACLDAGLAVAAHIIDAGQSYARGVALLDGEPHDSLWAELMTNLGTARMAEHLDISVGRPMFLTVAREARQRGDGPAMARAVGALGNLVPIVADEDFEQLVQQAKALVDDDDHDSRAWLLGIEAMYTAMLRGRSAAADLAPRAVEAGRRATDPTARFIGLVTAAVTRFGGPEAEGAEAAFVEAERRGAEPRSMLGVSGLWRSTLRMQLGDRDWYEAWTNELVQARAVGSGIAWWANLLRAALALIDGRWSDAKADAAAIREAGFRGGMWMNATAVVARARLDEGRADLVAGPTAAAVAAIPSLRAWSAMDAGASAEAGDPDTALEILDDLLPPSGLTLVDNYCEQIAFRHLADVCCHLEATDRVDHLERVLLPHSGHVLVGAIQMIEGAADRSLGQLAALAGRHDEASARFDAALELEGRIRAHALVARTTYWYAWARHRAGDRDGARRLAEDAGELASRLGMRWIEAQAALLTQA